MNRKKDYGSQKGFRGKRFDLEDFGYMGSTSRRIYNDPLKDPI